jgi:hypothetical protein
LCVARPRSATLQKDGDYVGGANLAGQHGSQARVSVVRLERRVATRSIARAVSSSDPWPYEQNRSDSGASSNFCGLRVRVPVVPASVFATR